MGFALTPYLVSNSFAICVINEGWSDAPCYTKRGEDPSLNQMKRWWSQYYEFKGTEWMESKKLELMQAIQNGNLIEWKKEDPDSSHHNVYMYYFLMGIIPNEDGLFAEEYYGVRLLSPQQQSDSGISFREIHCGIDLVLLQKYDGSPSCVTEQTKQKLIERGWTGNNIKETKNNTPDQLQGVFGNCACQERTKLNPDTMERCPQPDLDWKNSTHYIDNHSCRWIYLEKYLDENNKLNFAQPYDNNDIVIDDLQRIYDWCDYSGEKPDWYFDWSNQTHYIDSENCKWIEREWYEGEQFEKIIKYCTDPESNLTGKTSSISKGGEIKLDSKNCTWFHGGFYNQAWINQTSDPVPLIQNGNVMSPEGKVIRSVK
ncbi:MAG: hypothetical protein K8Q89_05120 [Nitrosarchaeum sp.]|nr:hypothetical protein [Nitrosarchaeum sp.]